MKQSIFPEARQRIQAALDWLCRSQDATGCGGSAAYYSPVFGWGPPYPETTGYIIPTLWRGADFLGNERYGRRAYEMACWLIDIQNDEGWFPGGTLKPNKRLAPSIFNTGQILFGLVEAARRTKKEVFKTAASLAANWLVEQQQANGRWLKHAYVSGHSPSYYSHVAWPLLECWQTIGDDRAGEAAQRSLDAVLGDQRQNGAFSNWGFMAGKPAATHTIAYTLQGLIESATILGSWHPYGTAAENALHTLMRRSEIDHRLAGSYDEKWNGNFRSTCLTGNCQLASSWLRIHDHSGDPRYLNAALKAVLDVCQSQKLDKRNKNTCGAIAGSKPFFGRYMRCRYPNWAAKFFVDALLDSLQCLDGLMPSTERQTDNHCDLRKLAA